MVRLPDGVLGMSARGEDWATWVDGLPRLADELLAEWELRPDGWAQHGFTALVLPCRDRDDRARMLKIGFPDDESAHEHLALQTWQGRGGVRLVRADPRRRALLLERLEDRTLDSVDALEACEVVAGLYGRLHVPAPPQLTLLSAHARRWDAKLRAVPRNAPVPHRFVEQAASLARDLAGDPATDGRLVHGDLHFQNVLASPDGAWLVHGDLHFQNVLASPDGAWLAIDPKPVSGCAEFEPAPMLWTRWEEVVATRAVRDTVRDRFFTLVDHAELDEDRARAWAIVRLVVLALDRTDPSAGADVSDLAAVREGVGTAITIAKAVQD